MQISIQRVKAVSVIAVAFLLLGGDASAQSKLPPCPTSSDVAWTNCFGKLASDGHTYEGEWKDFMPNGHGAQTFPDGATYVGEWKAGNFNGRGTFTWPSGIKDVGDWVDGSLHGRSVSYLSDGAMQVGEYIHGQLTGTVMFYGSDGVTTSSVIVQNDTIMEPETTDLQTQLQEALGAAKLSDFETALEIWEPLAVTGHPEAQYHFAIMNEHGEGIPVNQNAAFNYMQMAASQLHPMAQYALGIYLSPKYAPGFAKDPAKSHYWIEQAASAGVTLSQRESAINYKEGVGTEKNMPQAIYWFAISALNADKYSALELGDMYSTGIGVEKNLLKAYQWYYLATGYDGPDSRVLMRDRFASPIAEERLAGLKKLMDTQSERQAIDMTDACLREKNVGRSFKACGLPF